MQVAGPALGSVDDIVEDRSILPLYLRFSSDAAAATATQAVAFNSAGNLKFQLGMLTSRFRANHPLKACPACMEMDRRDHATAYWHREHQLPGVWVCRRHQQRLRASNLKATGVSRFQWLLPATSQFAAADEDSPISPSALELANMVMDMVASRHASFDGPRLCLTYRTALGRHGFLKGLGARRLDHKRSGPCYAAFVAPLAAFDQLDGLPTSEHAAAAELARLIGPIRSGTHPLRHLALMSWLFSDFGDFLENYKASTRNEPRAAPPDALSSVPARTSQDPRRSEFIALVSSGRSISGAAREVGIDTTTGMVWAAAQGISPPRRAKRIKDEIRGTLIRLLREGAEKAEVALAGAISIQSVTTLLRTEVGLHEAWKQAKFSAARLRNRDQWSRAINSNLLSGVKAARLLEPAVYAWLHRNDRDWLTEQTASMAKAVRTVAPRVDWDARDQDLAACVRQTALRLFEAAPERRPRLCHLYQELPELKAKVLSLDRLPLTRAAIFDVLDRTSAPRSTFF